MDDNVQPEGDGQVELDTKCLRLRGLISPVQHGPLGILGDTACNAAIAGDLSSSALGKW